MVLPPTAARPGHPLRDGRSSHSLRATPLVALIALPLLSQGRWLPPFPDFSVTRGLLVFRRGAPAFVPASVVSFACSAVLKFAYRAARGRLAPIVLGMSPAAHARRLRIADERSQAAGVAVVDVALLQRSASDPENAPMKPKLARQTTVQIKVAAAEKLEPKRRRLVGRRPRRRRPAALPHPPGPRVRPGPVAL